MVNIFQNPKWKQEYAIEINNMFEIPENLDNEDSIDNCITEKWENIKTIIKETKQQLIEKDEGTETFKNKWYDKECEFATEEMKKAREKWLIKGRGEKEEQEYHHKKSPQNNQEYEKGIHEKYLTLVGQICVIETPTDNHGPVRTPHKRKCGETF